MSIRYTTPIKQFFIYLALIAVGLFSFAHVSEAVISTAGGYRSYTSVALDVASGNLGKPSIIKGVDNFPMIAYSATSNGELKFIKCGDASCSTTTIRTLDTLTASYDTLPSIALGADGFPVIAYSDTSNGLLKFIKCGDASCSATTIRTLDSRSVLYDTLTSIALGADGFPVIAYTDYINGLLKFIKCGDASCSTTTISTLDTLAVSYVMFPSMALGADGFPVVTYEDYVNGLLKFIKCGDASCSTTTIRTLDTIVAGYILYPSITLGADGFPVITYSSIATTGGLLKFIKCGDASCSTTAIRILGTVGASYGAFSSTILGADGFPVIAYDDVEYGFLKLIRCSNSSCSTTTIRTLGIINLYSYAYPSVTLGADGFPVIAHYDSGNGFLKFIRLSNPKTTLKPSQNHLQKSKEFSDMYLARDVYFANGVATFLADDANTYTPLFIRCDNITCSSYTSTNTTDGAKVVNGSNGLPFILKTTFGPMNAYACRDSLCNTATDTILVAANTSSYSLAVGGDGFPAIVYSDTGADALEYMHCTKVDCSTHTSIVDIFSPVQYHPSFTFSGDGFPVIAYDDWGTNGNLKFAHCNDILCGSFSNNFFATRTSVYGNPISVMKGSDGKPVIFFTSEDDNDVLIHCGNAACTSSTTAVVADSVSHSLVDMSINELGFPNLLVSITPSYDYDGAISLIKCKDLGCATFSTTSIFDSTSLYPYWYQPGINSVSIAKDANNYPIIVYTYAYKGPVVHTQYFTTVYLHCGSYDCTVNNQTYVTTTVGGSQANTAGTGLVGYWSFNGPDFTTTKISDVTGNGHDAYFRGGATSSAKALGKVGQGVKFNGGTQRVQTINSVLPTVAPNGLTGTAWVKYTAVGSSNYVWETGGSGDFAFLFNYSAPSGLAGYCQLRDTTNGFIDTQTTVVDMHKGQFDHVACVYDPVANQLKFYLNGVLSAATTTVQYSQMTAGGATNIGGRTAGTDAINGVVDEVRMYDRALSTSEIKKLYQAGK